MKLTRLPIPADYLLGIDQDGYHILELMKVDELTQRRTYRTIARNKRDRYQALTWLYRYLAGAAPVEKGVTPHG